MRVASAPAVSGFADDAVDGGVEVVGELVRQSDPQCGCRVEALAPVRK